MTTDRMVRITLPVIAVFLGIIALRPYVAPPAASAQSPEIYPFYIEPGVHSIRYPDGTGEFPGKVMVDLRNGNIWGFPTGTKLPYPVTMRTEPPTTKSVLLGRFDFAGTNPR